MSFCKLDSTLLIVDDDADIRYALKEALELEGYEVKTAANGREALEAVEQMKGHPCLVLCDLRMPCMTGDEFTRQMKSHPSRRHIPIAIISAASNADVVKEADDFIKKPVDLDAVIVKIRAYCQAESDRNSQYTG